MTLDTVGVLCRSRVIFVEGGQAFLREDARRELIDQLRKLEEEQFRTRVQGGGG